ncbi:hypothetical protein P152DRAFT_464689 [Eremomyces bilateralis CBS 781.70]|uniref:Zn(2)-C6 fungal-type domain-containing protein n=1 Tax=Eremomyces bilateralis CBS 781.70 TaxID=1392243 RepID=A0A6G1G9D9_9PEZI|nr:uncharacterized protein P152DRAFT_464689 [Eremomyces bilateralis CBS 781.70]KAF1814705.1 hypothetical protein P152DRAFT_464689 [Eremomyces bilateralis CBS 781.70]
MQASQDSATGKSGTRVSLACVQCRSRHLRCDAVDPICSRCSETGTACTYLKSRRGGRPRVRPLPGPDPTGSVPLPMSLPMSSTTVVTSLPMSEPLNHSPALVTPGTHDRSAVPSSDSSSSGTDDLRASATQDPLLDLYYHYFHHGHPCALPARFMASFTTQEVHSSIPGMSLLVAVMQFIGSLYSTKIASDPLEERVKMAMMEGEMTPSPFEVQALTLYAIASYWCHDDEAAKSVMGGASDKAIALGMNLQSFADANSGGNPILAESWRRTWWTLYLVDAHIASSTHAAIFRTSQRTVPATVDLPCEEDAYESGNIPIPHTVEDYDNREFMDDDVEFSSFAYLVGLLRSVDHICIGMSRESLEDVRAMAANHDAACNGWVNLLAKSKRKLFREDGKIDELLFGANMGVLIYTVDIHRQLSTLSYSPIESVSSCAPPPPPKRLTSVYARDAHIHTAKVLQAITKMTEMLTLPARTAQHTPFAICMTATTTIAHLAACKHVLRGDALLLARERIRVAMGTIEIFAEVWPRAKRVLKEVKTVARELLALGPGLQSRALDAQAGLLNAYIPEVPNQSPLLFTNYFPGPDLSAYTEFCNQTTGFGLGMTDTESNSSSDVVSFEIPVGTF